METIDPKVNFSFSGCGFMGTYHYGVAACLKKYVPHLVADNVSGVSGGALVAMTIVGGIPIPDAVELWIDACVRTRYKIIGALSPSSNVAGIARGHLERIVPPNAHLLVNGKVQIALTRVSDMQTVLISEFESRAELIDALICAITIPMFVGLIPQKFRGERFIDGGFTNNLLIRDEHTVTVVPFEGTSDICPKGNNKLSPWIFTFNNTSLKLSTTNMRRFYNTLHPPTASQLSLMFQQGYDDAVDFLKARNLVGSVNYLRVPKEFGASSKFLPYCHKCDEIQDFAIEQSLLNKVHQVFCKAIDTERICIRKRISQYKIFKLFQLVTMPVMVYVDFMYAAILKVLAIHDQYAKF